MQAEEQQQQKHGKKKTAIKFGISQQYCMTCSKQTDRVCVAAIALYSRSEMVNSVNRNS